MTTVLVTGANRGIGLAFVQHYLGEGADVIGVCRSASEALTASGARVIDGIDLGDPASIERLRAELADESIDLLINNAGILLRETLTDLNFDQIEQQFLVNALAPLRVVDALLDSLSDGGKIALMTSRMGSIADNGSGSRYGYRMSKAALNAAGKSLAIDLADRGISVAILHPGYVSTGMTNNTGDVTPEQAVAGLTARIAELDSTNSGTFWHANGEVLPW